MAGLDYSIHRGVVYVAVKPPCTIFRTIAARLGHHYEFPRSAGSLRYR